MRQASHLLLAICLIAAIAVLGQPSSASPASQMQDALKPGGRYQVASAGDSAVLLDTQTGDTWYLRVAKDVQPPRPTWVAIKRQQDGQGRAAPEASSEFQSRLLETELQLGKLKESFGPRHPRVIEKQREVDAIRKLLQGR